jgi:16S rRNA (adenine1518-N6/adenine1519-N6)-dimethyltransferase
VSGRKIQHKPKQSLGQNFLVDENIARKIVAAIDPREDEVIMEIGGGQGAITGALAASGCSLIVVEIDRRMTGALRETFGGGRVEVIEGDILDVSFAETAARHGKKLRIVGNIPYHLTSPIFFRMFEDFGSVSDCTLMVQKEVARRIVALPGNRTYGILSVMTRVHGRPEILFDVSPNCFFPKPKVTSSILRVALNDSLPAGLDMRLFRLVVRTTFGKRRKTLRNSLKYLEEELPGGTTTVGECPVSLDLRPEALSVDDFILLSRYIKPAR